MNFLITDRSHIIILIYLLFCSGEDFDLTFGLLHTVEKSAEILVKVMSMAPRKLQTITPDDFRAVAKDFHVTLPNRTFHDAPR